ncbi:unnamed protein product [Mucor hiemalis]
MSVYEHDQQDSPWAILNPSLKQPTFYLDSSEVVFKPSYLEYPRNTIQAIEPIIQEEVQHFKIQEYLNEIEEIEKELIIHKNSIYSEKLKALEAELLSIENETHQTIIKQDKKSLKKRDKELTVLEAMFTYELEAIDKHVEYEKSNIYQDIRRNEDFARKLVTSEGKISTGGIFNKKRKEKSPSTPHSDTEDSLSADEEQPAFKKIHLSQKMSKLQAISDRQKTARSKQRQEDLLDYKDQIELDNDFFLMKQR